jgi:hypothetical protein
MGEHGPQDEDEIIVENVFVDGDVDVFPEKTSGEFFDFVAAYGPDLHKLVLDVPAVVHEGDVAGKRRALLLPDAVEEKYPILAHDLMRPQRDHEIKADRSGRHGLQEDLHHEWQGSGPGVVGGEDEDPFSRHDIPRDAAGDYVPYFPFAQRSVRVSPADSHQAPPLLGYRAQGTTKGAG